VLGDSIIRNVGNECADMKVECFLGIGMEQLDRVTENRDLGRLNTIVTHVGTNDLRRSGTSDYIMGDVHDLVNMARTKFSTSRVVLSDILRRQDASWQRIGAINSR
jgi:hypothetical protein